MANKLRALTHGNLSAPYVPCTLINGYAAATCRRQGKKEVQRGGERMTIGKFTAPMTRRSTLRTGAGLAGILATGRAPVFAQAAHKKLLWAHIVPPPESAAVAFEWMSNEFNERAKGSLAIEFHGGTLIPKELEIMNAVKTGNIAIGGPAGAAATVFPEMGAFLVPYLVKD